MKNPKALIAKILKEHLDWLNVVSKRYDLSTRAEVVKVLRKPKEQDKVNQAATTFGGIPSLTWATHAIVRGMQSESGSENLLALHVEERWLQTSYRYPGYPNIQRDALLFLSFQMWDRCVWLFPRLNPAHPSKRYHYPGKVWTLRYPLEFFCHCLWLRADGRIPEDSEVVACGPYADIFNHWNNPGNLAPAIFAACEYHLQQAVEPKGYEIHEFNRAPFTLLPVEILALRSVRERLGLPMPEVDHPLLTSPLVTNLPRILPEAHDGVLDALKAAVARFHQDPTSMSQPQTAAADDLLPLPPCFSIEEGSEKSGFLRRSYNIRAIMRFVPGETLETHWPRLLEALEKWRKKRGRNASILTISFQSDPALHPDLYGEYARRVQSDPALEAWIETLSDYTLSFQQLDGTDCRDLVWEKQPDGSNLFSEMKFSTQD